MLFLFLPLCVFPDLLHRSFIFSNSSLALYPPCSLSTFSFPLSLCVLCSLPPLLIFTSPPSPLSLHLRSNILPSLPPPPPPPCRSAPSCHPITFQSVPPFTPPSPPPPLPSPPLAPTLTKEMRTKMTQGKNGCRPVSTTSCTSSPSSGRSCSPAFLPRTTWTAGPVSSSPSSSSACSRPSSGTWRLTSAAPSASRTRSLPWCLWHSAHPSQVRTGHCQYSHVCNVRTCPLRFCISMSFYSSWWIICFFDSAGIICSFMSFFKRRTCFVIKMADILISSRLTFSPSRKNVSPKTLTLSAHLLLKVLRSINKSSLHSFWRGEKNTYIYVYINSINKQDQYWEDCQPPQCNVYFDWQVDLAGNGKKYRVTSGVFIYVRKLKDLGGKWMKGNRNFGRCSLMD